MVDDAGMAANSANQLTRRPRRAQGTWRVFALVEVLLAAAAVAFDLFLPTIVILLLASISLAIRRTGASSLGFRRVRRPARMALAVFVLTVGWSRVQLGLTMPILNRLTGQRQNLSQFESLQGNVTMLLILLGLSWTLAALGEETAYRGYLPTRINEVFGQAEPPICWGRHFFCPLRASSHRTGCDRCRSYFSRCPLLQRAQVALSNAMGCCVRARFQQHDRNGDFLFHWPDLRPLVIFEQGICARSSTVSSAGRDLIVFRRLELSTGAGDRCE
jgi:hypothetical protein